MLHYLSNHQPFIDHGVSICGILTGCSIVHWYSFTHGQKSCMFSTRIFWNFRVFVYFRCVEM